jgi:diacylglycerol kinase (ATP)
MQMPRKRHPPATGRVDKGILPLDERTDRDGRGTSASRMLIIYNPTAGLRRVGRLWRVLDVLVGNGLRMELVETRHAGHATALAREAATAGAPLVVAAGGDGTIAEVANGLNGSACALGVIPLGTANVLAHELGLPFAPREVASALAFARTQAIWPGIATGPAGARLFVQMLGVGFDAQVVHDLPRPLKRVLGRGAYVVQSLCEAARYRFPPIRLRLDGVAAEAATVVVSKGRFYGGRYLLAPGAPPTERGFTVALFERSGPAAALCYGAALPLDLLPRMPGLRRIRAAEVAIETAGPAQTDGDAAGTGPFTVRDAARPIAIVVS